MVGVLSILALLLAACGDESPGAGGDTAAGDTGTTDTDPTDDGTGDAEPADGPAELSIDTVEVALLYENFTHTVDWFNVRERFLDGVGLTGDHTEVFVGDGEALPALLSGSVWMLQTKADQVYNAIEQGADLVIVGIDKDVNPWIFGVGPGIETVEDLLGKRISGGPTGGSWWHALSAIIEEWGYELDDFDVVSIDGSADQRFELIMAGQLDGATVQRRHMDPLEEAGGRIIYHEDHQATNDVWVVQRDFWEDHSDAVCAYLEARIANRQWMLAGDEGAWDDNKDEAIETLRSYGFDPDPAGVEAWPDLKTILSDDGGLDAGGVEFWEDFLKRIEEIGQDFDAKQHFDLTCLWQAQENLGLELRPHPDEF